MIYQFKCNSCQKIFELKIPADSSSLPQKCPECGGEAVKIFTSFYFKRGEEYPRFNTQLGKVVNSRYEEDAEFDRIGAVRV